MSILQHLTLRSPIWR